jgi:hypothetical protein
VGLSYREQETWDCITLYVSYRDYEVSNVACYSSLQGNSGRDPSLTLEFGAVCCARSLVQQTLDIVIYETITAQNLVHVYTVPPETQRNATHEVLCQV